MPALGRGYGKEPAKPLPGAGEPKGDPLCGEGSGGGQKEVRDGKARQAPGWGRGAGGASRKALLVDRPLHAAIGGPDSDPALGSPILTCSFE